MSTTILNSESVDRAWYVIDAEDVVLGRLATRVATVLRGKHKPTFTPNGDCGDFVVVVNAEKVKLTGDKLAQKTYYRHSGYFGGIKSITAGKLLEKDPTKLIHNAVKGMLPRGPLGRRMLKKLNVYAGPEHPHQAQQPQPLELK